MNTAAQRFVIGTRGSPLALVQADQVRARLRKAYPRLEFEIRVIKTTGDKQTTAALARSNTKGLFTKELEEALLRRKIQVAVHSLKDLPTELPSGLILSGVMEREDAADVAVSQAPFTQPQLVFTSSPRRAFQARALWKGAEIREIRGNVETRLTKLSEAPPETVLLVAAAGLKRLDLWRSPEREGTLAFDPPLYYRRLSVEEMLPAPGQAAIGLEIHKDDGETMERLKSIQHPATLSTVQAERSFLRQMEGGCATPMAAHAITEPSGLWLRAVVELATGKVWRGERRGERREAELIGKLLADECLSQKISA